MSKFKSVISVCLIINFMIFGYAARADAQIRGNDRDIGYTLLNLSSKMDDFRFDLDSEFRRASINRNDRYDINNNLKNLENSISRFEDKHLRRRESADDVRRILDAAKIVDDFVNRNRFNGRTAGDWTAIRGLLDNLASNYGITRNWNGGYSNYPNNNRYPNDNRNPNRNPYPPTNSYALTGTYQLDVSRSENARDIAERAIRNGNVRAGGDAERDLENKLQAPEQLAIDARGSQITLASSNSKQITFTADGRESVEKLGDGRTLRVRSTLRGQELTVSSLGGDTDYTVTFTLIDNGDALRVTRRITTDYLRQTVFAESVYRKTDSVARLNDYNGGDSDGYSSNDPSDNRGNYPTNGSGRAGAFVVPNGTLLTGTLQSDIDTKVSQNNDRFQIIIQSPNEYRGAVIEGYLSGIDRSGKISGRSQATLNFERIRLPNGQTYDFAGYLRSVTDEKGETVKVDNEGVVKGESQTKETVTRGGIGAGIGAIIGAIAGGGKGAAIGAIIGGGAGAGSVIVQGKEDLELRAGSSITVESSSPIR